MSATGLEVFDRSLHTTNTWLNEIGEAVGPDKQRAYHALRAVLFAVRDRLTPDEAFHLSAELPLLIRGIFWEGYRPASAPQSWRSRNEFFAKIEEGIGQIEPVDPEAAARAVLGVLSRHVPTGEIDHVKQMLPDDVRLLFNEAESVQG